MVVAKNATTAGNRNYFQFGSCSKRALSFHLSFTLRR
nr:MAG TPA: hypothetical protein [Caudoviricetes sp.]